MTREDSLVRSAVFEHFYEDTEPMTFADGLNFAAAFTSYDNETEWILDPTYADLNLQRWRWGFNPDGSIFETWDTLSSHICSLEELGLTEDRSNAKFFEVGKRY